MKHQDKVIVTCAITGAVHMPCMSPFLPITPDQIIEESVAAAEAGAAIVHLHARDPENGMPTTDPEVYGQYLPAIKERSDVIINLTTGQPAFGTPEEVFEARLAAPLKFAPEITSFNMGPMNLGLLAFKDKFIGRTKYDWEVMAFEQSRHLSMQNPYAFMERIAKELGDERGVRFEYECFDIGHLYALAFIADLGWVKPPFFVQSIFGFAGGLGVDVSHVVHMKETADRLFGDNYCWSVLAAGKDQMRLTTMAAAMGGNVRVGMEDSLWLGKAEPAKSNADQTAKIVRILKELSLEIATPDEARAILGCKGRDKVNF